MILVRKKTNAQKFLEEQLKDKEVAKSFYEGLEDLRLGVKVAQLRQKRGLSQTELAAKIKSSSAVISRVENNAACSVTTLRKIADALDSILEINLIPRAAKAR